MILWSWYFESWYFDTLPNRSVIFDHSSDSPRFILQAPFRTYAPRVVSSAVGSAVKCRANVSSGSAAIVPCTLCFIFIGEVLWDWWVRTHQWSVVIPVSPVLRVHRLKQTCRLQESSISRRMSWNDFHCVVHYTLISSTLPAPFWRQPKVFLLRFPAVVRWKTGGVSRISPLVILLI